jgi:hypothetical protein
MAREPPRVSAVVGGGFLSDDSRDADSIRAVPRHARAYT